MKKYDHSFHAYLKGIILLGFALLTLSLILSGNIIYYIAPKMMPFIYFSMITFFILGVMQIFRSTKTVSNDEHICSGHCDHDHEIKGPFWVKTLIYSIFILPVLFGFILPDQMLNSSVAANRGIQYGSGLVQQQAENQEKQAGEEDEINEGEVSRAESYLADPDKYVSNLEARASSDQAGSETDDEVEHFQVEDLYGQEWFDEFYEELAEEMDEQDIIIVTEENYLDVMTALDLYPERFIGKEIEKIGFVYREPDFEDHQLVVARFAMTCCTADASVYGTLIEAEDAAEFEEDSWIFVRGTIEAGEYGGFNMPIITDSYIVEVDEPAAPYVYPSFNR